MELLLTVQVTCEEPVNVKDDTEEIVMIPFSAVATGEYFNGKTIGRGVDTQRIHDGKMLLSARYMLEGVDHAGQECRLFIENNGTFDEGFTPQITTDSVFLKAWKQRKLSATVESISDCVIIKIYGD